MFLMFLVFKKSPSLESGAYSILTVQDEHI